MIMKASFDSRIFTKIKPQKQNHAAKPTSKEKRDCLIKAVMCDTYLQTNSFESIHFITAKNYAGFYVLLILCYHPKRTIFLSQGPRGR
jgi:hypothetical protein